MKKTIVLFSLICTILSACNSSDDDPINEYAGPWEIIYYEDYHGMHTESQDFYEWFKSHQSNFRAAQFSNLNGSVSVVYTADNGDWIEVEDYNRYYNGSIEWIELIDKASESEVQAAVSSFESFTIINDRDRKYDKFSAYYKKQANSL